MNYLIDAKEANVTAKLPIIGANCDAKAPVLNEPSSLGIYISDPG